MEECGEGGEDSCGDDTCAPAPNADAALVAAPMPAGKGKGKSKGKIQAPGAPSDSPLRAVAKAAGKGKGGPPAPAGRNDGDGKGKGKDKALTAAVEPTKLSVEPGPQVAAVDQVHVGQPAAGGREHLGQRRRSLQGGATCRLGAGRRNRGVFQQDGWPAEGRPGGEDQGEKGEGQEDQG